MMLRRDGTDWVESVGKVIDTNLLSLINVWLAVVFLLTVTAPPVRAGAYFALDHYSELLQGNVANRTISGIVSLTGSYRFHPDWDVRATWNRVVTNYSSDTDVILGGIGYRF